MKRHPLAAYLALVTVLSGGLILLMKLLGQRGFYIAQFYMFTPAIAAVIARIFFYDRRFSDARLNIGRLKDYLRFYGLTLVIVAACYLGYWLFRAVSWDFTGDTFLSTLGAQMEATGQDINDLPLGLTPKITLVLFAVGGLTVFNIPFTISGFGEEFGWRGYMLPLFYRLARPWRAFIICGLIWFTWHTPLVLVFPRLEQMTAAESILNVIILAVGSVATFIFLAYVFARSGSIWVASFAHAVLNNASRSLGYFAVVESQVLANLALTAVMVAAVLVLQAKGSLRVLNEFFSGAGPPPG
jgi:membrane protease YdiL (CAAX protease family)